MTYLKETSTGPRARWTRPWPLILPLVRWFPMRPPTARRLFGSAAPWPMAMTQARPSRISSGPTPDRKHPHLARLSLGGGVVCQNVRRQVGNPAGRQLKTGQHILFKHPPLEEVPMGGVLDSGLHPATIPISRIIAGFLCRALDTLHQ